MKDLRERAYDLLERIHIARVQAMRECRKIDRIQISRDAELVLIAGTSDMMTFPSHTAPSVMGIQVERVDDGPEFKLIFTEGSGLPLLEPAAHPLDPSNTTAKIA